MKKTLGYILILVFSVFIFFTNIKQSEAIINSAVTVSYDMSSMTGGIQEAIDKLPPEGGEVFIPAGTYTLRAPVYLRSNIQLTGSGVMTILKHAGEINSFLAEDAFSGQNKIVVKDASAFKVGMGILLKDNTCNDLEVYSVRNFVRKIVNIKEDTLILDDYLIRDYNVDNSARAVNTFPIIAIDGAHSDSSTQISNVIIENLKIDGNSQNVNYYSFIQSGILLFKVSDSIIRNLWVENVNGDGISDQGYCIDTRNKIQNNIITNSGLTGIHLGSGNRYAMVTNNIIRDCKANGITLCWGVQYAAISDNTIYHNKMNGIGDINDNPYGGDKFNIIKNNVITYNGFNGIEFGDNQKFSTSTIVANNVIMNNSKAEVGKYSGISIKNTSDIIISNNVIQDGQENKTQKYGIYINGICNNNTISENILYGNLVSELFTSD